MDFECQILLKKLAMAILNLIFIWNQARTTFQDFTDQSNNSYIIDREMKPIHLY